MRVTTLQIYKLYVERTAEMWPNLGGSVSHPEEFRGDYGLISAQLFLAVGR